VSQKNRDIQSIELSARQIRLKALRQDLTAELAAIKQNAEQKKAAIREGLEGELQKTDPALRDQRRAQARREQGAIDAEAAAAAEAATKARRDQIKRDLRGNQESVLEGRADRAVGFKDKLTAGRDLEAFKIRSEFQDRAKALAQLTADPAATAEQKKIAERQLREFAATAGKRFDKNTLGEQKPLDHLATAVQSRTLSGVGARAAERRDNATDRVVKNTQEGNKIQKEVSDKLSQILAMMKTGSSGFVAGVAD
jgi:hypothetical protein